MFKGRHFDRSIIVLFLQKSTFFAKARRPLHAALKQRIREIAETRVHYGYRRIHVGVERVDAAFPIEVTLEQNPEARSDLMQSAAH